MTFLIRNQWVEGEAALRGIKSPRSEVRRSLARAKREAFPQPGDFRRFLRDSCQVETDVEYRLRVQIRNRRLLMDAQKHEGLAEFATGFSERWRPQTVCTDGFVVSDCANHG